MNGYTYILFKKIELLENGFLVSYTLENTGEKDIITDEYTHNFLSINNQPVSPNYALSFPFALMSSEFEELVDPEEKKILWGNQGFIFWKKPRINFLLDDSPKSFYSCAMGIN
ncbi:MAG: hypothetical protein BalsKO_17090 [Balneolaceae bacterium]